MADLVRSIEWDDNGSPVLSIRPKINPERHKSLRIPLNVAWQCSRDHNPRGLEELMKSVTVWMYDHWNMGLVERNKWISLATFIEDGLDDLLKAPPRDKIVDVAVKQQMQEAMSTAMKNAEFDSRTNTVKMVVNL